MIVERVKSIKEIYLKKYEDKILWFSFSFTLTDLMYPQRAPYKTYGIFELNKNRHINIALSYKDRNGWDKKLYDENFRYVECDFNNFCEEKKINWTIIYWEDFFFMFGNKETVIEDILDYIKTAVETNNSLCNNIHIDFLAFNPNL